MSHSDSSSDSPRRGRASLRSVRLVPPGRVALTQTSPGVYALSSPFEIRIFGYRGSSHKLNAIALPMSKTPTLNLTLRNVSFARSKGYDPTLAALFYQGTGKEESKHSAHSRACSTSLRFVEMSLEIVSFAAKQLPKISVAVEIFHEEHGSLGSVLFPVSLLAPKGVAGLSKEALIAITKQMCPCVALSFTSTCKSLHDAFEDCDEFWHFIYCKDFLIPLQFDDVKPHKTWREKYKERQSPHKLIHYEILETIGDGTTSEVVRVKKKCNDEILVLKQIPKLAITSRRIPWEHVANEKEALLRCRHRNVVRLYATFQDAENLNFVLENAETSLHDLARRFKGLAVDCVRFVAADLVNALEYLHTQTYIIHRDVKPENMLICSDGRLILCDFGTCVLCTKETPKSPQSMDMLTGTPEFMAPEIREGLICYASDLWSFGISLYQLSLWKLPFRGETEFVILKLISEFHDGHLHYPQRFPTELRNLIDHLVRKHPEKRLGYKSFNELKEHTFFDDLDWKNLISLPRPEWRGPSGNVERQLDQ